MESQSSREDQDDEDDFIASPVQSPNPALIAHRRGSLQISLQEQDSADYRVVIMGAARVGKTCIVSQFLHDKYLTDYHETIEELHRGEFVMDGTRVILDILDTSGAFQFPAMRKLAIATSDAFVLVFSVESEDSFKEMKRVRDIILEERETWDVPIVIVGNKCDVEEKSRIIEKETAEALVAVEWGHGYVETSAKEKINIEDIFKELVCQAKVQQYRRMPSYRRGRKSMPEISLMNTITKRKKRHSCNISWGQH